MHANAPPAAGAFCFFRARRRKSESSRKTVKWQMGFALPNNVRTWARLDSAPNARGSFMACLPGTGGHRGFYATRKVSLVNTRRSAGVQDDDASRPNLCRSRARDGGRVARRSLGSRSRVVDHALGRSPTGSTMNCGYCELLRAKPEFSRSQNLPEGYCGRCHCGKPGHVRHFPGSAPYSGAWCDFHYWRIAVLHPMGVPGGALWFVALTIGTLLAFRGCAG
jgi:hypothetical protein